MESSIIDIFVLDNPHAILDNVNIHTYVLTKIRVLILIYKLI